MDNDAMELRMPTPDELRLAYRRDLTESFLPQEMRPPENIIDMTERGFYFPLCLYDGGEIIGECFLLAGRPGWVLLDYFCVTRSRRNAGLGGRLLTHLLEDIRARFPDSALIVETQAPAYAPDPAMAERRLEFYERNGATLTDIEAEVDGVRYRIVSWATPPRPDAEIQREYENIYRRAFASDEYGRRVKLRRVATDRGKEDGTRWN